MSQQVNLLNPRLQRKRDALSLNVVALGLLAIVIIEAALSGYALLYSQTLQKQEVALKAQNQTLLAEVEATRKLVAERKPSVALAKEIGGFSAIIGPREEALERLRNINAAEGVYSNVMRGFARQAIEGVWLTEFSASAGDLTIRGRLSDSALLPAYMRRLNEEPAFKGRRFLALDMKSVEPVPEKDRAAVPGGLPVSLPVGKAVPPALPYIEFSLQGILPTIVPVVPATAKSGGGAG